MTQDRYKARPTTYKGIKMRSRLEAGYAMWLDHMNFKWEYEPECFADHNGQYLPDFLIHDVASPADAMRRPIYIEVKPKGWGGNMDDLAYRMDIINSGRDGSPVELVLEQPGSPPRTFLLIEDGTAEWVPLQWVLWHDQVKGTYETALGWALEPEDAPWPDRYWEGRRR